VLDALLRAVNVLAGEFLDGNGNVGFAVMFVIYGLSFLSRNEKSPRPCAGLGCGFGWDQPSK
jgi:hypothetical protein